MALWLLSACSGSETANPTPGELEPTTPPAEQPLPGESDTPTGDAPAEVIPDVETVLEFTCGRAGAECNAGTDCCEGTCADDGGGTSRCVAARFCTQEGGTCGQAADCCSFSCNSEGQCNGFGNLCTTSGASPDADCTSDNECCSGQCEGADGAKTCTALAGATCGTLGERCSAAGSVSKDECCSGWCVALGTLSDGAPNLRCGIVSECRSQSDICSEASDCCSGRCVKEGDDSVGRCGAAGTGGGGPGSLLIGEPCSENNDCRSQTCASSYLGGPKICQRLGGCLTQYELCQRDEDCCSWDPLEFCSTQNGNDGGCKEDEDSGVKACAQRGSSGHGAPGEVCGTGVGSGTGTCCSAKEANGQADPKNCRVTNFGTNRCFGSAITEPYEEGEACVFHEQCDSGLCLPYQDEDALQSTLRCEAEPRGEGELCTIDLDCESLACGDSGCDPMPEPEEPADPGEPAPPVAPECQPLGGTCAAPADCCSGTCWLTRGTCTSGLI